MKRRTSPRKPGKKNPEERDPEPGPSTGRRVTTRGRGRPVKREAVAVPPPSPRKSSLAKRPRILGSPTQTKITKKLPASKTSSVLDVGANTLRHSNSSLQSSLPQPQVIDLSMPAPTPSTSKGIESNRNKLTTAAFSHSRECENDLPMKKMKLMLERMSTTKTDCDADDSPFLFNCPTLGLELLKEVEMYREIFKYLLHQPDDETGKVQSLMIRSCNRDGDKLSACIAVLLERLTDLIETPDDPKGKTILCDAFFKENMFFTLGLSQFLKIAGYSMHHDAYRFEVNADEAKLRLQLVKATLETTEPIPVEMSRNPRIIKPKQRAGGLANDIRWLQVHGNLAYTQVKVVFPDGSALMGTFKSTESFEDLIIFIRDNLQFSTSGFELKNILYGGNTVENLKVTFVEARLVPAAIFGFRYNPHRAFESLYLKPELLADAK